MVVFTFMYMDWLDAQLVVFLKIAVGYAYFFKKSLHMEQRKVQKNELLLMHAITNFLMIKTTYKLYSS